uniref:Ribosomal RNA methyltransferase SPB1-like C-terminal domain-containing protein n=1 Tax=Hyaloperonospora arabidopsidis (strain Emoy2) TaxID=559515 RepID=M4B9Z9_HYAAE
MNAKGIDISEADAAFSLKELKLSKNKVDELENAGADLTSDEELQFETDDDDGDSLGDSDAEYDELLEASMETAYEQFLTRRGDDVKTRKAVKRTKVAKRAMAGEALVQDSEMFDGDMKQYQKMINPDESFEQSTFRIACVNCKDVVTMYLTAIFAACLQSSDDDDADDEADELNVSLKVPEKSSTAVSRWFSDNKLFDGIGEKEELLLPEMPKTDKEIRHAKRKAAAERKERRTAKKLKKEAKDYELEFGTEFEVAAGDSDDEAALVAEADDGTNNDAKAVEKRVLIRSGMGAALENDSSSADKFEVVAAGDELEDETLPVGDDRKYDSDHEVYDAEDRAKTLALATMMVRKSKAKDLIDASYNRYTWNDSEAMPDWFADDEEKHYRPQLPIPKNVLAQMKERFMEMATKPVKKVAEARGRKQRMAMKKLKTAKKKATDIANLPDMAHMSKKRARCTSCRLVAGPRLLVARRLARAR